MTCRFRTQTSKLCRLLHQRLLVAFENGYNHFQIKILELERFQTLQYLKRLIVGPKNPTILLFTQYKKKSYTTNLIRLI